MPGIRVYLGLDAATDAVTRAWYATAIDWCHAKLSERDFVDSAGASVSPPDSCVLGVYEFVRVLHDYAARGNVNVIKTKTGAREEQYSEAGMAGRLSAAAIAAWPYIEPFCEDPTLFASGGA